MGTDVLPRGGGEVVLDADLAGTRFRILRAGDGAHVLDHGFFGRFEVAPGGRSVRCTPAVEPDWFWQRFLVAQPLPLAALLAGLECLHASAVAVAGEAVLILGTSGAGKTSVALHMAVRAEGLITDDVSAIELRESAALVHAGARVASVDPDELARLASPPVTLGTQDGEARVLTDAIHAGGGPWPVGAVYVLSRRSEATRLEVHAPAGGPAATLLGATFNAFHRDPARLATQLDVASAIADSAPVLEVSAPLGLAAEQVATAIVESVHAGRST